MKIMLMLALIATSSFAELKGSSPYAKLKRLFDEKTNTVANISDYPETLAGRCVARGTVQKVDNGLIGFMVKEDEKTKAQVMKFMVASFPKRTKDTFDQGNHNEVLDLLDSVWKDVTEPRLVEKSFTDKDGNKAYKPVYVFERKNKSKQNKRSYSFQLKATADGYLLIRAASFDKYHKGGYCYFFKPGADLLKL